MKSLIRLASLLAALSFATPISAATVAYAFEAVGTTTNPEGRLAGQLSFDLDGAALFSEDKFFTHHAQLAQLDIVILGGRQDGAALSLENLSIVGMYSSIFNVFFTGNSEAGLLLHRWNAPFITAGDLDVLAFDAGAIWLRSDGQGSLRYELKGLTGSVASSLVTIPLPSTFPLLLGACLGTAFFGRRKHRA